MKLLKFIYKILEDIFNLVKPIGVDFANLCYKYADRIIQITIVAVFCYFYAEFIPAFVTLFLLIVGIVALIALAAMATLFIVILILCCIVHGSIAIAEYAANTWTTLK